MAWWFVLLERKLIFVIPSLWVTWHKEKVEEDHMWCRNKEEQRVHNIYKEMEVFSTKDQVNWHIKIFMYHGIDVSFHIVVGKRAGWSL